MSVYPLKFQKPFLIFLKLLLVNLVLLCHKSSWWLSHARESGHRSIMPSHCRSPLEPFPLTEASLKSTPLLHSTCAQMLTASSLLRISSRPPSPACIATLLHSTMGSSGLGELEVIRGAGRKTNWMDRKRGPESPKAADTRPLSLETESSRASGVGRVSAPFQ